MFLLGRLTVPVQQRLTGVLFYPPLNLILCHTNSVLHIFDGSSCRFLRSVVLSNTSEKLSLCYLGNSGCLVVTCGTTFNARSHYADVILLDDILCGSIETPEQNTTLSFRNDQLPGLSAMLVTEENKPTLKGSCLNVERCEVDFHRDSKFNTVSIQGAFSKLVSWFQVFSEHHELAGVPLPALTPCLNYRLLRLCTSDVEAMSMAYWRTSLMNVEGFRRLTFTNWPHMEYR
ncbi:unnamed protein product [Dicrocoelium dendriticum]|nr:unnamed protein product [Dicrocoelium dendriticum]